MTDRPIIFSAPMVRALLAGRKTQTRRLATSPLARSASGDRLYVREGYMPSPAPTDDRPRCWGLAYAATGGVDHFADAPADFNPTLYNYERWTPSIHMPRWASRLTLIVEEVRVEQLQAISNSDARDEGVEREPTKFGAWKDYTRRTSGAMSAKESFATLWLSLHGLDSWAANPFVVALTFCVVHENIDRIAS